MKKIAWRPLLINIGISAAVLGVVLVVLELGIRLFFPQPTDYFYFKADWTPGERFQLWGVDIAINSHGQRDYDYPLHKPDNTYRIAIIGDSVPFGTGVAIQDTYPKRLEALLNEHSQGPQRFEVLTFTNGGNEPTGYLEMLRESASQFEPDLVMVSFTLNDFERPVIQKTAIQRYYDMLRVAHEYMRVHSHLYFLTFERSRVLLYRYKILDKSVRNAFQLAVLETNGEVFEQAWRYTQGTLRTLRDESQALGAGFAIIVYPYEMQLSPDLLNLYREEYGFKLSDEVLSAKPQRLLHAFGREQDIPILDVFPQFQDAARHEALYFREFGNSLDWVHPNARGHEVGAAAVYDALKNQAILPAPLREQLP